MVMKFKSKPLTKPLKSKRNLDEGLRIYRIEDLEKERQNDWKESSRLSERLLEIHSRV